MNFVDIEDMLKRGSVTEIRYCIKRDNLVPNNLLNTVGCNLDVIKVLVEEYEAYTFSFIIRKSVLENRIDILKYLVNHIYMDFNFPNHLKKMYITEIIYNLFLNSTDLFYTTFIIIYVLKIRSVRTSSGKHTLKYESYISFVKNMYKNSINKCILLG